MNYLTKLESTGSAAVECSISKRFDLIVFDLDDTLVSASILSVKDAVLGHLTS